MAEEEAKAKEEKSADGKEQEKAVDGTAATGVGSGGGAKVVDVNAEGEKKDDYGEEEKKEKRPPSRREQATAVQDSDEEEDDDEFFECYHPAEKYHLRWLPPGSAFKVAIPLTDRVLQEAALRKYAHIDPAQKAFITFHMVPANPGKQ